MIQVGSEVGFDVSNKDDELSNFLSNHNDRIQFLSPSVPSKFSYIGGTRLKSATHSFFGQCDALLSVSAGEKYKNKL